MIGDFLRDLRRRGVKDERVLAEVRDHLEEAASHVGEERAIEQFGTARELARALQPFPYLALVLALVVGVGIGYVDSRPHWDDTGVSALVVVAGAFLLSCWRPRWAWCWAVIVGGFIPLIEIADGGNAGSLLALALAAVAAAAGWLSARLVTALRPSRG